MNGSFSENAWVLKTKKMKFLKKKKFKWYLSEEVSAKSRAFRF